MRCGTKPNYFFWIKLTIALGLTAAILAFGIAEEVYMNDAFDDICDQCDRVIAAINEGDDAAALELADAMREQWAHTRDVLEFMYPNADVKDIMPQLGELSGDLQAQLDDDAVARAKMIAALAENSKNLLSFKWKNIL